MPTVVWIRACQNRSFYFRYANTAFVVNVLVGWLAYFVATVFGEKALWLGIGAILASLGNCFVHAFLFNIRGKKIYNPGMISAIVLFLSLSAYSFYLVIQTNAATLLTWIFGIVLGVVVSYLGY